VCALSLSAQQFHLNVGRVTNFFHREYATQIKFMARLEKDPKKTEYATLLVGKVQRQLLVNTQHPGIKT